MEKANTNQCELVDMEMRSCAVRKNKKKVLCWHGFPQGRCPLRKLENEKLIMAMLLTIAISVIVWTVW